MTDPKGGALRQAWRAELLLFLLVRLIHLAQGVISIGTASSSYHPPRLAVAVLVVMACESLWLLRQGLRAGAHLPSAAIVDAAVSLAGLIALGVATMPADRTTSLNWMLPYSVGAAVGLAISMPNVRGAIGSCFLAGGYLVTTWHNITIGGGPAATALANTASYVGFFAAAAVAVHFVERFAAEFDQARHDAVEKGERLAVEQERRRHQRLIHDSVIQTLEAMASGRVRGEAALRARARAEAFSLRSSLGESASSSGLAAGLEELACEMLEVSGLNVQVVAQDAVPQPEGDTCRALLAAAREALINVAKHAGVDRAVLRLRAAGDGVELVVRDDGKGFEMATTRPGFGTVQSIQARLTEAGGRATISSEPGMGTRVALWGPVP